MQWRTIGEVIDVADVNPDEFVMAKASDVIGSQSGDE